MRLEKFQEGCYDVFAQNGRRVGVVSGGAGLWAAEFEKKVLGYHSSKAKAGEVVLAAAGFTDIYQQMCDVVKANPELLVSYANDLHEIDKSVLKLWACATDMIWVVRPHGTHLVLLDLPRSSKELMGIYEAFIREPHQKFGCYFIESATMKMKKITFAQLKDYAAKPPKWAIVHDAVVCQGMVRANIVKKDVRYGVYGEKPTGSLTASTTMKPTAQDMLVLEKVLYEHAVLESQSLFAQVKDVRIEHDGELLYSSLQERERAQKAADKAAAKAKQEVAHV